MWSTGEGNGKPLQYSCLESPMNSMERQKDRTLKEELPGSVGAQYATGDQWRNNSRKNEEMEPKQKQHAVVDVTGDGSKIRCCKEQYCIGTWNVRSMNQGKLEVVKQEMERVNIDILGVSELKWTGMGEFNSDDHFQLALIHGPDIPGHYAILLFTASELASITSHLQSWVLFLLWLHPFILSGVISPLISSSILGS